MTTMAGCNRRAEVHVSSEKLDLRCRNDQRRVAGQVAGQEANGMGLSGAGRPAQQDSLAGRLTELAQLCAMLHKVQNVAVEQLQRCLGQNHVRAFNGRQLVDHEAARPSTIVRAAIE